MLVKVSDQMSYADTLRAVRSVGVDFDELGTHVSAMRKTRSGDLLVELTKGDMADAASDTLRSKLAISMTES